MQLSLFRTFLEVAKQRSISRASEVLYLTQPAVTKQVQALEQEYGRKLFQRNRKELILTEEGKILLDYAQRLLALLDETRASVKNWEEVSGQLKIASNLTLGIYVIPKIVAFFRKVHPQIRVEVFLDNTETIIRAIKSGDANFGFIGRQLNEPNIVLHSFYQDRLVVVIGKGHTSGRNTISWKKLLDVPFIGREKGSDIRTSYEKWFKERGIKIVPAIELNNTEAIKQSVREGLGFSILPWCTVEHEVRDGLIRVLSVPYFTPIQDFYICHFGSKRFSKAEKTFLTELFNRLSMGPACFPETFDKLFAEED